MPHSWPQIDATTLGEKAYVILRNQITSGRLRPGDYLREQTVSAAMRVSRTPLREAFGRLASEGFLDRVPNRGFRIPVQSAHDLLELYPIVAALEVLAAKTVLPRLGAADLAALREINRRLGVAAAAGNAAKAIRLNDRFHQGLTAGCENFRLSKLLDDLRAQITRFEVWSATKPEYTTEALQQHKEIVQAVAQGRFNHALNVLEKNRLQTYRALTVAPSADLDGRARKALDRASALTHSSSAKSSHVVSEVTGTPESRRTRLGRRK